MTDNTINERRQMLAQLVKFLFMVGLLAFTWVVVSSLTFTAPDESNKHRRVTEIDISYLKPGELTKISIGHKEAWIYHRTMQDIEQLKKTNPDLRSQHDAYFVFYPYEPKRQCQVNWDHNQRSFYDTCNARYFDLAGRLVDGKNLSQVQLPVARHHFKSGHLIQIDAR